LLHNETGWHIRKSIIRITVSAGVVSGAAVIFHNSGVDKNLVLFLFLVFASLRIWGFDVALGRIFTRGAVSILVMLLLSFITWQVIKARIDQKPKEEGPENRQGVRIQIFWIHSVFESQTSKGNT
jgi:hypothetical protein